MTEKIFRLFPTPPKKPIKNEIPSRMESFFTGFRLGTVSEDFIIRNPEEELKLAIDTSRSGKRLYWDLSFIELLDGKIETQNTIHTGEKLAVLPNDIAPAGLGRVCVIPYNWHLNVLEKYVQTGIQPFALIYVAVPNNLIVDIDPNSLEAESRS